MGKWCNWRRSWLNTTTCLSSSWLACSLQAIQRHIALHKIGNNNKKSVTYLLPPTRYHMHNLQCRITKDTYIYLRHAFHLASRQEDQTQCSSQALLPSCLTSFPSTRSYWIFESRWKEKNRSAAKTERHHRPIPATLVHAPCSSERCARIKRQNCHSTHREKERQRERKPDLRLKKIDIASQLQSLPHTPHFLRFTSKNLIATLLDAFYRAQKNHQLISAPAKTIRTHHAEHRWRRRRRRRRDSKQKLLRVALSSFPEVTRAKWQEQRMSKKRRRQEARNPQTCQQTASTREAWNRIKLWTNRERQRSSEI